MAFSHINLLASEAARASALVDRLDQAVLTKAFRGDLVTEDRAADTVATGSSTNDI